MRVFGPRLWAVLHPLIWNVSEQRIRAGWRFIVSFIAVFVGVVLAAAVPLPVSGTLQSATLGLVLRACVVVVVAGSLVRALDRRPLRELGFTPSWLWGVRVLAGVSIAFGIGLGATVTMLAVGWATIDATVVSSSLAFLPAISLTAVYALCVGIWEETLFRGLLLRNGVEGAVGPLSRKQAVGVAVLVVAVLHALLRLPALSSARVLPFYILVSGMYGLAYVVSGDLAFPIGLHAGVDFVLLGIVGFHDASTFPALVHVEFTGPTTAVGTDGLVMVNWVLLGCLLTVAVGRHLLQKPTDSPGAPSLGRYRHARNRTDNRTTETDD